MSKKRLPIQFALNSRPRLEDPLGSGYLSRPLVASFTSRKKAMRIAKASRFLRRITPNLFDPPLNSKPWSDAHGTISGLIGSLPMTIAYGLVVGVALGGSSSGIGVLLSLYGAAVVGLIAVVFGGCPHLVTGSRASTLLIFAGLIAQLSNSSALANFPNPAPLALALASVAVFAAGLLQILFGVFRLGRLASYVPVPVMAGFMNGTSFLVMLSQVWPATSIAKESSVWNVLDHLDQIKPAGLMLALATALAVILLRRTKAKRAALLLAFVGGTFAYHALAAFGLGPALGGTVPPPPESFTFNFIGEDVLTALSGSHNNELLRPIALAAISMAFLASLDSLFATAATDQITLHRSDANRQLLAEGMGNTVAGLFSLLPASGGGVRTQSALDGGMVSAAAPISIALFTLLATLLLTPAIDLLSITVMAGLLIVLGFDLMDKWTVAQLRRVFSRAQGITAPAGDLLVVGIVTLTALVFNLVAAVGVGVLLSVLLFVIHMTHSPIRRCYSSGALIPHIYGDVARCRFLEQHGKAIAVIETEGALFFGTASELEAQVQALILEGVVHVVVDLRRIKYIDATGGRMLERLNAQLTKRGGMLAVSHVDRERRRAYQVGHYIAEDRRSQQQKSNSRNNWSKLTRLGTIRVLGESRFVHDTDGAVALCEKHLLMKFSNSATYPLLPEIRFQLANILQRPILRHLRNFWIRVAYEPGETVFTQGSTPNGVFFVAAGRVDVLLDLPSTARKRKVQTLVPGSIFGEMALLDRKPRSANVIAVDSTICYWISSENFDRLKQEHTDIAMALLTNLAMIFTERLRATNAMLVEMEI